MPATRLALGTRVRTASGAYGIVSAHSTISGRVIVRVWRPGIGLLHGKAMDVAALMVLDGVETVEAEAA